ncbi:MAG: HAMP domain-containing sensor histidine kinase [Eubacteriales bacterium]|nr:HAMP domain-containing sensor histidine kinase [Eubacteriales bacterium]
MINKDMKQIAAVGSILTLICAAICLFINPICAVVCFVLGMALTGFFLLVTKKRYDKLRDLNTYLSLVCSGQYNLDIADNAEGELSILKNNLYKVIILLRSQNDMLEKDKLYLADALANISHQLKTPLTSMMVMSDSLKENKVPEKQSEFIGIIENQLDRMKWLITNLLKLSKLDAGTADFKKEDFSVCRAVNQSLNPFLITMDLKEITIINQAEDFTVCGDEDWTAEAFGNIIKNCIEHTDKGGRLEIYTQKTTIYNSVIIRDNGCGITKEDLPHIFERFYHGKNASNDSVGIGLALAKTIFDKENANVKVTSEEAKGTQFEIRFYKAIV